MKPYELIVFDMDGLMFDTERLSITCWQKGGAELGIEIPEAAVRRTIGRNITDTKAILLEQLGQDFPFETARALRDKYVLEHCAQKGTPALPGLYELLDYLEKQNIKRAVATSTEIGRGKKLLEYANVLHRFNEVVYGNMIQRGKPFPDVFLKAAELCGVAPEACLVLEDSPAGVEAAKRAGMPVIMITDLVEPDEVTAKTYTARLTTLHDVINYLQ